MDYRSFYYTVQADDLAADGLGIAADVLTLNGGSIRNLAGIDADLDLGPPCADGPQRHTSGYRRARRPRPRRRVQERASGRLSPTQRLLEQIRQDGRRRGWRRRTDAGATPARRRCPGSLTSFESVRQLVSSCAAAGGDGITLHRFRCHVLVHDESTVVHLRSSF